MSLRGHSSPDKVARCPSAASVPVTASFLKPFYLPKVKLLSKELAATREAAAQAAESLCSAETTTAELRERLQHGARELDDLAAVKDARCARPPGLLGGGGTELPVGTLGQEQLPVPAAGVAWRCPLRFPTDGAAFQDKGPGGPASLCAAHAEEGGGDVQEEVSVPGPGGHGVDRPQQNLALPGAAQAGGGAARAEHGATILPPRAAGCEAVPPCVFEVHSRIS